jgi:hypothetical protein
LAPRTTPRTRSRRSRVKQLADVQDIDVNLHAITASSAEIEQQAESVAQAQLDLSASTERASVTLARFDTGGLISRLRGR